jgi:hypothetical protein
MCIAVHCACTGRIRTMFDQISGDGKLRSSSKLPDTGRDGDMGKELSGLLTSHRRSSELKCLDVIRLPLHHWDQLRRKASSTISSVEETIVQHVD